MESVRSIERMTVVQLRELAKERKVRLPYGVNKAQIVRLLSEEEADRPEKTAADSALDADAEIGLYKPKPLGYYNEEYGTSNPVALAAKTTSASIFATAGRTKLLRRGRIRSTIPFPFSRVISTMSPVRGLSPVFRRIPRARQETSFPGICTS